MRIKLLLLLLLLAVSFPVPEARSQARIDQAGYEAEAVKSLDEVVETFRLTAAYPNPFNPQTQFTLTLAQPQQVRIEVYNLLGRRVAELHEGLLEAQQRYTFTFEAGELPSGLYLIRVQGEDFSATQRVTLLK